MKIKKNTTAILSSTLVAGFFAGALTLSPAVFATDSENTTTTAVQAVASSKPMMTLEKGDATQPTDKTAEAEKSQEDVSTTADMQGDNADATTADSAANSGDDSVQ
jgi:hypothetical protein